MKLVKYSATWCGPCKRYAPVAEQVSQEMGIPMESLDIDENPDPAVMGVPHTRLVADNGAVLAEKTGAMNAQQLRSWIEENTPRF